jgi:hypothetical protein
MKMLRLHKVNHCVFVPEDPHYRGMVQKVKDYVAYGKVDAKTLAEVLETVEGLKATLASQKNISVKTRIMIPSRPLPKQLLRKSLP